MDLVRIWLIVLFILSVGLEEMNGSYELPENCKKLECAEYDVMETQKDFEIRSYRNAMWVSTSLVNTTSYKEAASKGFDILFSYIQGNNDESANIPMTAPVLVNIFPSTGPFCNSSFVIHFYLPKKFQKSPPKSPKTHPVILPKYKYVAVRRFGGFMDDTNIPSQAAELKKSLKGSNWESQIFPRNKTNTTDSQHHTYSVAGYNSPFEYENRVNEVLFWFDKS